MSRRASAPGGSEDQPQHTVYIALGSNLGDRSANLRSAIAGLPPAVVPTAVSSVYETPPWGYEEQPAFLNQVVQGTTRLPPVRLMEYLKELEKRIGRRPTFRNGPRVIDLDILFYDQEVCESHRLTIPHPRLQERAFVLVPLAELAPDLFHPVLQKTIRELLTQIDSSSIKIV